MNSRLAHAMLATTTLLAAAALAHGAPQGPAFGSNRYETEIRTARGEQDVDDFVTSLIEGERLSVVVTAARKSALLPDVTILRPDGSAVADAPHQRKAGRSVAYKKLAVDATGPWTVRVAGRDATEGAYTVAFKVAAAPPLRWKKQELGGASPLARTHVIPAVDGARLDVTLTWGGRDAPVALRALRDPSGTSVPGASGDAIAAATAKKTKAVLKGATLFEGDGPYELDVGIADGTARYSLTASVRPVGRPAGRRATKLDVEEPYLGARAEPVRGVAGRAVRITGGNFSQDEAPRVLFDGHPGRDVVVTGGGASLSVVPPLGVDGDVVDVAVVNPDGQADARDDYFEYARPPVITDLVREDGSTARGGATTGGQTFRVRGEFLHPEQSVLFGDSVASPGSGSPVPGELRVVTPTGSPGLVAVAVVDPYGRSSISEFRFEFKPAPTFDVAPYDPKFGGSAVAMTVTATGTGFLESDVLLFDGEELAHTVLAATQIRFQLAPQALGDHTVELRDRVGTVVVAAAFTVKGPPVVTAVNPVEGPYSGSDGVPLAGGAIVEVAGSSFHALDTVTLTDGDQGTQAVEVLERSFAVFRFLTPSGAAGLLDLTVTDVAGQSFTVLDALHRQGYADSTVARLPTGSGTDDLSAWRGAIGDLDRDGDVDDVVIVSFGANRGNVTRGNRGATSGSANAPGTRAEMTRILIGDDDGVLTDGTSSRIPAAGSDPSGSDDWNGMAVAIGDLDGSNGPEIVVGGVSPDYTAFNDVRILRNTGAGSFVVETGNPLPDTYLPPTYAYDETGAQHLVFTARYNQGLPSAIALGDLDGDTDLDMVVGRDWYDLSYAYIDPYYVDFTESPPYVYSGDAYAYFSYTFYYYPATKVFVNDLSTGGGWSDGTAERMPSAGDSNLPIVPGLHARDLVLGDLDRDGSLDIVVTWDDPLTVTPYGLYGPYGQATVATRILINDGSGDFSGDVTPGTGDVTGSWLPAASGNEFWQANRLALADLDNDLDLDLVLLHEQSIDAHTGTTTFNASALRVLRNNHPTAGFTDVTASAVPALPTDSDDNWRGGALTVTDVDGDGFLDLVVGTRAALRDDDGNAIRSTRILLGGSGLTFRRADGFLPAVSQDSGEVDDLLLGDLPGSERPVLIRLSETAPADSTRGDFLRSADWER